MRNKLLVALLVACAGSIIPGAMLASLDQNRPPTDVTGAGARLVWFLPTIGAVGWCAFRAWRGYRQKERLDAVLLPCVIVSSVAFTFFSAMAFLNKHLDSQGSAVDMVVTDVFVLDRADHHTERIVAVSLPAEAGGTAVWQIVNPNTALSRFPIGSRARIIWHKGYFGVPWCEYVDDRFPQYHWRLTEYYKNWRAQSAMGQFSAESPHKNEMRLWGIPISEVEDLKQLSSSSQH